MTVLSWSTRLGLFAAVPLALAACVLEDEPPRRLTPSTTTTPSPPVTTPIPSGSSSGTTTAPPAPTDTAPMLVEVDTDQVMTADPGQGVGVFVEYASGGKWHVWWTCDTARTQQDCDFTVNVVAATGAITDLDATQLTGGFVATPSTSRIETRTRTSTEVHGITFSTDAGAVITVDAGVSGVKDSSFIFFVQDGQVNGGFSGKLTNPLQLQGNTP